VRAKESHCLQKYPTVSTCARSWRIRLEQRSSRGCMKAHDQHSEGIGIGSSVTEPFVLSLYHMQTHALLLPLTHAHVPSHAYSVSTGAQMRAGLVAVPDVAVAKEGPTPYDHAMLMALSIAMVAGADELLVLASLAPVGVRTQTQPLHPPSAKRCDLNPRLTILARLSLSLCT
jgi:hypothetical protein